MDLRGAGGPKLALGTQRPPVPVLQPLASSPSSYTLPMRILGIETSCDDTGVGASRRRQAGRPRGASPGRACRVWRRGPGARVAGAHHAAPQSPRRTPPEDRRFHGLDRRRGRDDRPGARRLAPRGPGVREGFLDGAWDSVRWREPRRGAPAFGRPRARAAVSVPGHGRLRRAHRDLSRRGAGPGATPRRDPRRRRGRSVRQGGEAARAALSGRTRGGSPRARGERRARSISRWPSSRAIPSMSA